MLIESSQSIRSKISIHQRRINESEYETKCPANSLAVWLEDAVHDVGANSSTGTEDR